MSKSRSAIDIVGANMSFTAKPVSMDQKVAVVLDYSVDEMLTQIEVELPAAKMEKEKLDNERVMIKTLLANIEKNRVKWRKEVFDSDTLSLQRKLAMQGIKDRIDTQARLLEEENLEVKEKNDAVRRKIELLTGLKSKIE